MKHQPILFAFCGPTASGKSTICKHLIEKYSNLMLSVSTTTRIPRAYEKEGEHYYFVKKPEFEKRVDTGCFLEHAVFNSEYYGTEKINIERASQKSQDILLDIEVQGVEQLRESYNDDLIVISVLPPSMKILRERLSARNTEDPQQAKSRLEIAIGEIKKLGSKSFSQYVIINDSLSKSYEDAESIVKAERCCVKRQSLTIFDKLLSEASDLLTHRKMK